MQNSLAVNAEAQEAAQPTFSERVRNILTLVAYDSLHTGPWEFLVGSTQGGDSYLQVQFNGTDALTGRAARQHGRKWYLSPHMTRSEIVQTALKAVLTAEEHEIRERFKYRGRRIFGPHFDVDALFEICDGQHIDVRPAP